ncbi:MAG: polysaccharide biosynthesis protein [Chitinophagaceae bacterium]|nr:polysaccharide biosynthesis protein [Chitinophagaceae bacterium]
MWYGLSSIAARFLNYLLTPYLTRPEILSAAQYGEMSMIYSAIPFMSALFTYGFEITFFRYSNKDEDNNVVFNTTSLSIIITTLIFTTILLLLNEPLAVALKVPDHPQFITWTALIIAVDTFAVIPFAKLRLINRPRKYAFIRIAGILTNIVATVFFYSYLPDIAADSPASFIASWYDPNLGVGYYILANLISSILMLLMLAPEVLSVRFAGSFKLWKEMLLYSLPLMIAGFAGVINETFDRIMLGWLSPDKATEKVQVGIYGACYKLSLLINIFIQAFRLGAEPFFFAESKKKNAPETYSRVMTYIVIAMTTMFLVVTLYIDFWKYFIQNEEMWVGLKVVPILLIANMSLGVYYNLSFWYKLSQKTQAATIITLIGAAITLGVNFFFIPIYGYMASAWATLACYSGMMVISYFWGRRVYPVPYEVGKIGRFFGLMLLLYFAHVGFSMYVPNVWLRFAAGTVMIFAYLAYVYKVEKDNLPKLSRG